MITIFTDLPTYQERPRKSFKTIIESMDTIKMFQQEPKFIKEDMPLGNLHKKEVKINNSQESINML